MLQSKFLPESRGDFLLGMVSGGITLLVIAIPISMLLSLLGDGLPQLSLSFLIDTPADAGRTGGIGSLIISTFWILFVCLLAALPIGLGCALCLSELIPDNSKTAKVLGYCLDVLSGVPSIVFGLFGYRFFSIELGMGFSILSGGLALACMVLPLMIRSSEQSLRAASKNYRPGATALAVSRAGFITHIILPVAAPGIAVATILSTGRALAETAVLLFTAGYVTRTPDSVFDSGRALSVHIYDLAMNVSGGSSNAAATALVLIALLILINSIARWLGNYWHRMELS